MKHLSLLKFMVIGALSCGIISCQQKKPGTVTEEGFPREKTLYLAGFQWGDPNTFNPLSDWPAFPVGGKYNLMYEPLVVFNSITGKIEGLLADSPERTDSTISVKMNPMARWSDGKPLTSADVKFTFEIGKRFKGAPTAYVWDFISDITVDTVVDSSASGEMKLEKIVFFINKKERNNPLVVMDILQNIRIVPRHSIEALLAEAGGELAELQKLKFDKDPVVSGPYNLLRYSNEKIVLKRRDDYWGCMALYNNRLPQPVYIIHPIYKSNDHFSIALQQGNLDISATFIPRIWLKAKEGVATWYKKEPFFIPATIPMLQINTTRYPLSDRNVRRAMAYAINYKDIRELAVSGYSPPILSGLILPFGVEADYCNAEDIQKYGVSYDPEKARAIMKEAGYTSVFDADGKLNHVKNAKGEKVPTMSVKSPAGWSDWESMVQIAVKGMRAAGIDVREGFVDASLYWSCMPVGDFDLLMQKPVPEVTPSKPWSRFDAVMSSRNWKPEGEKMNENQGRYNNPSSKDYNPEVDNLLKRIPTLTDNEEKIKAYRQLNIIFMQDMPALPLAYLPEQFYEFSTRNWINFPTEENSYAPPQCLCYGAGTKALWEIKSVAAE
ncbi:MAG: ABC transporter substrate-binding protein [Chitinispirillaceae bacterium]|nr:ABC transporter substrate-binding protein [Chitinispirillaceae bacterium]